MSHDLKYSILVPEATAIGESVFATARKAIEARSGVSPVEVFLDGVQSDGVIHAGDLEFDLTVLNLRLFTFGANSATATTIAPATPTSDTPIADSISTPATSTSTSTSVATSTATLPTSDGTTTTTTAD